MAIFLTLFMATAFGAANAHGSVSDLLWPFLNVGILFTFLGIILGRKGNSWFKAQAISIKESYDYAMKKDLQAQTALDNLQRKFDNLPTELQRIEREAKEQSDRWQGEQKKQMEIRLEQMRKDAQDRTKYEKRAMADQINNFLARAVVVKVKDEIKKSGKWSKEIHRSLMKKLEF